MALADLDALIDASGQNLSQFKGLTGAYVYLGFGVPTQAGYTALINSNNDSNFGAGPGVTFNDENVIINTMNALYQGNADAKATFDALLAGAASLQDKLTAVYNSIIPEGERSEAGLAYFQSQADFYIARAAELDIEGANGPALVAAAALLKIAIDNDIPGLGDGINDLIAAVDDGSAMIPEDGAAFTPLETADGAAFDGDDDTGELPGADLNFTDAVGENIEGTAGDDAFSAVLKTGAPADSTFNLGDRANGLGGTDTFNLFVDANAAAKFPGGNTVTGIEIINLISTNGGLFEGGKAGTVDASLFSGATQVWQANLFNDVENVGAGVAAGFRGGAAAVGDTVFFTSPTGMLAVDGVKSASVITVDGKSATVTLDAVEVDGSVLSPGAGAPGILNINGGAFNAVSMLDLDMTSNTKIDGSTVGGGTLTDLDASGSTGGITSTLDFWGATLKNATFGEGKDAVTITVPFTNDLTVDTGAGNDMVSQALVPAGAAFGEFMIALGGGEDVFQIVGGGNIAVASEAKFLDNLTTVTDFSTADDTVDIFPGVPVGTVLATQNLVDGAVDEGASLFANLGTVAAAMDNIWAQFVYGGDLYLYTDAGADNLFNAGDGIVKLAGVTELLVVGDNLA